MRVILSCVKPNEFRQSTALAKCTPQCGLCEEDVVLVCRRIPVPKAQQLKATRDAVGCKAILMLGDPIDKFRGM